MNRIFRCHPKLDANRYGPTVKKQPLHLRQSDLDSGCGPHCAVMALMLLGEIERPDIENQGDLKNSKNKSLAKMWKRSSRFYFVGTKPSHLKSVFAPYKDCIESRLLKKKGRIDKLINVLGAEGTCIVGISNDYFSHWVLAVGVGSSSEYTDPDLLLMLDPDAPTLPLTPWNATLSVKANVNGFHRYQSSRISGSRVAVTSVLALTPILIDDIELLQLLK
jgi:hypothetical protein